MAENTKPPTDKKIIVNPKAEYQKHQSSEVQEVVTIVVPQSFKDYMKKLDDYMKDLAEKSRKKD